MKVLREMPLVDSFDEKVVCSTGDVLNVIGHCSVKDLMSDWIYYDTSVLNDDAINKVGEVDDKETESTALDESLEAFSDVEIEPDKEYGCFGFKNSKGEVVIKPQYRWTWDFSQGLCPVNLGRTYYTAPENEKCCEDHYGYIDSRGKTVIPFLFDEASTFSKYGVAAVSDNSGYYMIDLQGKEIPGTRFPYIEMKVWPTDRFIEFCVDNTEEDGTYNYTGLYDTKERKVLCEPKYRSFHEECDEDTIRVTADVPERPGDQREWYINSNGEYKYPWQIGKELSQVNIPDEVGNSIVAVSTYHETVETEENDVYCFYWKGKTFERRFWFGVMNKRGEMIIPAEYRQIERLSARLYFCQNSAGIRIVEV